MGNPGFRNFGSPLREPGWQYEGGDSRYDTWIHPGPLHLPEGTFPWGGIAIIRKPPIWWRPTKPPLQSPPAADQLKAQHRIREQAQRLAEQARARERALIEARERAARETRERTRAEQERRFRAEQERRFQESLQETQKKPQQRLRDLQKQRQTWLQKTQEKQRLQPVKVRLRNMRIGQQSNMLGQQLHTKVQIQPIQYYVRYLVEPIKQKTKVDCLFAGCRMIVRHKLSNPEYGFFSRTIFQHRRWLEIEDNPSAETEYLRLVNPIFDISGLRVAYIPAVLRRFELQSEYIPSSPEGFLAALREVGPFVYVGLDPAVKQLGGRRDLHAVVVTGIGRRKGKYFLDYNDPGDGKHLGREFYDFLLEFMPVFRAGAEGVKPWVIHLGRIKN